MGAISSCQIWQIISFILPPNEYVYAWTTLGSGPAIDLHKMSILAKINHLFIWCWFWSWRVCKQVKLSHLDAPKTNHCLVRILVQNHNLVQNHFSSQTRGRYSHWRSLSGHVERIFVHKNRRGGYWRHLISIGRRYVPHSRSYTRCFAPCFWRSHYQPQSWCRLAISELRFDTVRLLFVGCRQR